MSYVVVVAMRTTKTTLLLVIEQTDEVPAEREPAIEATGELVRARPIRNIRTTDSSAYLAKRLDSLSGWLRKAAS